MKIIKTALPEVVVLEPRVFSDERGFFQETFHAERYHEAGIGTQFVQDNQSRSRQGVLRGLHYQLAKPQAKLVRVARGQVFDVAVDIRHGSPTFGHWAGVVLDDEKLNQIYIPAGFAHGFCVLSEEADFVYKCSDYYDPESEYGVAWDDPEIGIEWPSCDEWEYMISAKDKDNPRLAEQQHLPPYNTV